jgi:uncharacterized protein with NAD-binding domain and iron-sulfur cluster
MAGVTTAWELSRPGWRDRFDAITLYQRGWVLGGKGASTRGPDGRILEHGLHVWPGYYDNAFRVIRECYEELDRVRTDPACPIHTWRDAFVPAPDVGVFEHIGESVETWLARFHTNELVPGLDSPDIGIADLVRRGVALAADMLRSAEGRMTARAATAVDLLVTVLRGISTDGLLHKPGGFGRVDDEDFREWLRRHGARTATVEGGLVRGMYDLVFGYRDGDRGKPAFSAGLGVFLAIRMFLDYKGSLFWKMTAGMGDVVFAPLHQVLVRRGVLVRYFHNVEALIPDDTGSSIEAITFRRQAPADVVDSYEPLRRVRDIPCFPDRPALDSPCVDLADPATESQPCALGGEPVTLRRGVDFDSAVLAVSLGAIPEVAKEVVRRDARWQAMIEHVQTVRTRSLQVWLRPDEASLGWRHPGATLAGLDAEFDTCASMSHLLAVEDWPAGDAPGALAYLCSATPDRSDDATERARLFVRDWSPTLWPDGAPVTLDGGAVLAYHAAASTDASDRYVQSLPGSDCYRLRADESGLDNLVLAGDWTNCGLNAGCIEAAVVSGLQAAAAVEGRPLCDRVIGPLTWDWL